MTDPAAESARVRSAALTRGEPIMDDGASAAIDRVLREPEYRERLSRETADLFRLEALLRRGVRGEVSRRFCVRLAEVAERVEYGLLDVGARGNRTYAFFTEAVAAVGWIAKTIHALLHLRGRIRRYLGDRSDLAAFRSDLDACLAWLSGRLVAVLSAARADAEGVLGLDLPSEAFDAALLAGEEVRWRLPQDVDAAESIDERERIVDLATSFVAVCDEVARAPVPDGDDPAVRREFVRSGFGPASAQETRVRMHAIQSTYDSAVAATPLEAADAHLKVLRGYVSILLHLTEAVAYMLQLHSRLEDDVRSASVKARTRPLVPPDELLRWALAFGLANTALCVTEARGPAREIIERYGRTKDVVLDLPPGKKLHLRPAGLIARVVLHHGRPVEMRMGDQIEDARQLMDVILLAAGHPTETKVGFRGDERALADLQVLFEHRLGEDGLELLPASLAYLREPIRGAGDR